MKYAWIGVSAWLACFALADEVVLKDGRIIEGRILSETQYEVEIETARSDDGLVRHVQVIDQSLVESMARGDFSLPVSPVPVEAMPEEKEELLSDVVDFDSIETWLESGLGVLQEGGYDQAIQRYRRVLDHPRLVSLSREDGGDARQALELRRRSLRLTITALEGKIDYLEEREKQAKESVKLAVRQAEEGLRDFEREQNRNKSGGDFIEMRSRQQRSSSTGLEGYEERLEQAQAQEQTYQAWSRRTALEVQNLEAEVELLEELEDQLDDILKRKYR